MMEDISNEIRALQEYFKDKPVEFSKVMLNFEPYPYQEDFLLDNSKRIVFLSGRQVGKSTITAIRTLWYAFVNNDVLALVIATNKNQAKMMIDKIKRWISKNPILYYGSSSTTYEIRLFNGSKIIALPSSPDSIRGFTANMVIVDEAAFVDEEIYVAIEPTLMSTNGTLILLGTPSNRSGRFWYAWNSPQWSKHHATSFDNPLNLKSSWIDDFRNSHTEADYRREILGEFVSDESLFFDLDAVRNVAVGKVIDNPREGWEYYAGVDIARTHDDTCLVVIGINPSTDKIYMHKYYLSSKSTIPQTARWILDILRDWKPVMLAIDTNGIGVSVYDILAEHINNTELSTELVPTPMSKSNRMNVYNMLKQTIEQGNIVLLNDENMIKQFSTYTTAVHKDGRIEVAKGKHAKDDIVDALALAVYAYASGSGSWQVLDFMNLDKIFRPDYWEESDDECWEESDDEW